MFTLIVTTVHNLAYFDTFIGPDINSVKFSVSGELLSWRWQVPLLHMMGNLGN